jgi:hypothetical protein
MGRTTKLTPERQQKIVNAILSGNYFEVACRYAGVAPATGYEWMARGEGKHSSRKSNRLYAEFAEAVRKAEADEEVGTVAIVKTGLRDTPKLALDFLARRHPARWGSKETLTILKKLASEVEGMTDDELLQYGRTDPAGQDAPRPGGEEAAGAGGGE